MNKKITKSIPSADLYKEYLSIKTDIDKAIAKVIADSAFIGGKYVEALEEKIASFCQTKYAVALNSGTDGLYLSLWALGVGAGDKVITTPFTFIATAEVIAVLGATPIFVDIEKDTFNIDATQIEEKITKKTKAIIPVHLFGQPAQMDKIKKLAKKYKLFVIEDACQAIGAEFNGKKAGSIGDIGCFSFFPSKNLGGYGDGGIITTNSKKLADKIRLLRNHGSLMRYHNEIIGVSSRLDGIQASILLAKLPYLDRWNKKRREIAKYYNNVLKNVKNIELPKEEKNSYHVYNQYTIRVKNGKRDMLKKHLLKHGITSMIYYFTPLHLQKALKYLNYKKGDFPIAEKASTEVLSLPVYPELSKEETTYITNTIKRYV